MSSRDQFSWSALRPGGRPDFATLFASVGAPPPDGSNAAAARPFDALPSIFAWEDVGGAFNLEP